MIVYIQEEKLKDYCSKKGYTVIKIYRDIETLCLYYSNTVLDIIFDSTVLEYDKLIISDIYQISEMEGKMVAFFELLNDRRIAIESLNDGIIGEDLLFGLTMHQNVKQKPGLKNTKNDF